MIDILLSLLKWFIIVTASLLLVGFLFEQYSRKKLEKTAFQNKTFVEINNKPLHYVRKGQGNCTVVFQSGMGSSHAIWQKIQDSIAQDAVTISYDRNGLFLSESSGLEVTNDQVTAELEALLQQTNCPKPYILVGHSMAGIYLRPFIHRNAGDISGIIFAEAAHPQQINKASAALIKSITPPPDWLIKFVINTGIYRTLFSLIPLSAEIPFRHPLHLQERNFFYRSVNKLLEELKNDRLNFADAERYADFGNIPLTVIMGTSELRFAAIKDTVIKEEYRTLVNEVQQDLLNLSSDSRLIKAENSGHILQINDAALLINEIRKHIQRTGR